MATVTIPTLNVVYKEVFVMLPLYRATRQWLEQNQYEPREVLYHFRKGTSISPAEKELRIWWRTKSNKSWHQHLGTIYNYHIDIDWNVIKMYDVEIMMEGKKKKVQKGELIIKIKPYIVLADFEKARITHYFDNWIRTRLIKKNVEENKKILYQDAYRLQGMIKKYLELKTFIPDEEPFHEKFQPI